CSAVFTAEVQGELIFLSIVNIFLSITAVLGNTLILVALHKETSLNPPSKLLYRSLAVTDFCVGTIAEPLHVSYWISVVTGKWDICYLAHLIVTLAAYTFCGVCLITLTAISVDRLLALLLGLRYRQVVTVKKTYIAIYLPSGLFLLLAYQLLQLYERMHLSSYLAWQFTSTLVYVNSSLNPFIYCWKIREVKLAVKETLRRLVR
ncbi:unnamed protein product, partial [Porites lobata]